MAVAAAAIYCRISKDQAGTGLGVQRQEQLCRELAGDKGWPVADRYVDNDVSAFSGARRPAYDQLCRDIEAGRIDAVVCVDLDRLTRRPVELEHFMELADRHHVALANVSGDTDLSTSDGRFKARILGAVARQESERKSERIRRQRAQALADGQPSPGRRRFGFASWRMDHHPVEAQLIRDAAARILAGTATAGGIAREWNAAGITTVAGGPWDTSGVVRTLAHPRNAGLLTVGRGGNGTGATVVGPGDWQPILDRETYERLAALKHARRRPGRPPTGLLSGIARCARCGTPMRQTGGGDDKAYRCRRWPAHPDACGGMHLARKHADPHVWGLVVDAFDSRAMTSAVAAATSPDVGPLVAQLEADEAALAALADDHYVHQVIGRGEFLRAREQLLGRIERARRTIADEAGPVVPAGVGVDDVADPARRRQLVELVVDRVIVHPVAPRSPRLWHPDRLEVVWRA